MARYPHGNITIEGKAKPKKLWQQSEENYSVVMKLQAVAVAKKTSKEAILDYSNGMFIVFVVVLELY